MKRKLALFMAVMMTLSLLPMNVFARTDGYLTKSIATVPKKTLMFESDWLHMSGPASTHTASTSTNLLVPGALGVGTNDDVEYYIDGTDLVLKVVDQVNAGDQFKVTLANSEWFFRGNISLDPNMVLNAGSYRDSNVTRSALKMGIVAPTTNSDGVPNYERPTVYDDMWKFNATPPYGRDSGWNVGRPSSWNTFSNYHWGDNNLKYNDYSRPAFGDTTYNWTRGIWGYVNATGTAGVYFRYPHLYGTDNRLEVPYRMEVATYSAKEATVTLMKNGEENNANGVDRFVGVSSPSVSNYNSTDPLLYPKNVYQNGGTGTAPIDTAGWEIRIPLVAITSDKTDATISVDSNTATVTTQKFLYGLTASTATNTEVTDPQTARDEFPLVDDLVIRETRLGSIRSGQVYIKAPSGFKFKDPNALDSNRFRLVNVGVESGLAWGNPADLLQVGSGTSYTGNTLPTVAATDPFTGTPINPGVGTTNSYRVHQYSPVGKVGYGVANYGYNIDKLEGSRGVSTDTTVTPNVTWAGSWDYAINYKDPGTTYEDQSTIVLSLNGIQHSDRVIGAVFVTGLELYAEENAPFGEVKLEISNVDDNVKVVTNQTFVAGTRVDWTISLKTITAIPELVNGRYSQENPWLAVDADHKTARVEFKENTPAAWWAQRQTVFSLPEGVKFRKIQILKADKLYNASYETSVRKSTYASSYYGQSSSNGIYLNDGEKHGYVTLDGNQLIFNNLKVEADKKAVFEMDMWVSIESGFKGDVTLSVAGSAIPEQPGVVPAIVIAKQISPISIATKINDIKIGYQYQPTASIELTENRAGVLERGKDVRVSITDLVSPDMYFSTDTKVAVKNATETGSIKIKNINNVNTGSLGNAAGLAMNGGTIRFEVSQPSTKASTIVLSDVAVKIDRTVPETNKTPYKVVVWGTAIANNYQYINDAAHTKYPLNVTTNASVGTNYARDLFGTAGIMHDYIKVVSAANDKPNVLYSEVRTIIGEKYYTVNGKQYDMDAAAYISKASNSTMVPLRFVANALGIKDEAVIWDNENRTVTIIAPDGKIAQFKIGDSKMVINGTTVSMTSPDGLPVAAEITGDRSYVPFRALGDAFGIPVVWEEDTQAAVYNKGAGFGSNDEAPAVMAPSESAAPSATPAPTATPATR